MSDMMLIDAIPILKDLNARYRELNRISNNAAMHISVGARISQIEEVIKLFAQAPILDYAPVVHARWELVGADKRGRGGVFNCTACNRCRPTKSDYCPNCGAKMDLKKVEHEG